MKPKKVAARESSIEDDIAPAETLDGAFEAALGAHAIPGDGDGERSVRSAER